MKYHCILTAKVAEQLVEARLTHVLPRVFASVTIPPEVREELKANEKTQEWVKNPDAGIIVRGIERLDKGAETMLNRGDITKGEAQAISLAKEFASRGDHCFVLSDKADIAEYVYAGQQPNDIRIYTAGLWNVSCIADANGIIDLDFKRAELEKICPLNESTRPRVEGYLEIKHDQEVVKAQSQGQVH